MHSKRLFVNYTITQNFSSIRGSFYCMLNEHCSYIIWAKISSYSLPSFFLCDSVIVFLTDVLFYFSYDSQKYFHITILRVYFGSVSSFAPALPNASSILSFICQVLHVSKHFSSSWTIRRRALEVILIHALLHFTVALEEFTSCRIQR